jgi:DNA repair protein RecO (recombination protein O)
MLYKTRGIVFRFTKYGDTSIIVNIFTELFGLQSYIVNSIRTKSAKSRIALYQPLTLLDLVVYHKENVSIARIKEIQCAHPFATLHTDVKKSTLALFLNEILNKSIREQSHAVEICSFLFDSLEVLDRLNHGYENFHLIFMIKLSRFLGFGPHTVSEVLAGGIMVAEEEAVLKDLLSADFSEPVAITNSQRRSLLNVILQFYSLHIENFGEVRSVQVLREVLG